MSKKIRLCLGLILAIVILPLVAWGVSDPRAARAHFVSFSEFRRLDDRLFVSPSFANEDAQALARTMREAEARVVELFGGLTADPWIIVAADSDSANQYSFNLHGTIHASPFGRSYVVVGPEGLASADVIAHELAHAEHLERVGYLLWRLTPSWFVEGLAMQVDHRPQYGDAVLARAVAGGALLPEVQSLVSFRQFSRGDLKLNYALARQTVSRIYRKLGPSGISSFLSRQRFGTSVSSLLTQAAAATPDA